MARKVSAGAVAATSRAPSVPPGSVDRLGSTMTGRASRHKPVKGGLARGLGQVQSFRLGA